ncbi:cohesin domain-containing protein [Haloarchaeobius iranensis]|uniref:Cohesin domain-containing protein n=1 Tax=Haloarchaeobius iranensis TaxID=996166 RepID=A0A1G9SQ53_9EURY|nr:cohesin domain-containing protein [Haloarchaeobius iranensis]SDM36965.1 Cohesin domain-containing protein [Haloarchaeobius iranensis]
MASKRHASGLVVLVALAMVCGALAPGVVAAEQSEATIAVGDASAEPGETVTVAVAVEGENVAGYQANLTWDPSVLRFESVEGADFSDPVQNANEGWVFMTQSQSSGTQSPTVARVTFTVVGDAGDETDLAFVEADTSANDESSQLATAVKGGTVTVDGSGADVDADGDDAAADDGTAGGTSSGDGEDPASGGSTDTGTSDGDGGTGGLSPTLVAGGVGGAALVLGAGYVLGQRSGGGGE